MYEIWIEENGRELLRQTLSPGSYVLGRQPDTDLHVASANISRQHLRLDVRADRLQVTDLGSTNGTAINGQRLAPQHRADWDGRAPLRLGPVSVHVAAAGGAPAQSSAPARSRVSAATVAPPPPIESTSVSSAAAGPKPAGRAKAVQIYCQGGTPSQYLLSSGMMTIGRDFNNDVRLLDHESAGHHCTIRLYQGQVQIISVSPQHEVTVDGQELTVGRPHSWEPGQMVQVGTHSVFLTLTAPPVEVPDKPAGSGGRTSRRLAMLSVPGLVSLTLVCLCLGAALVLLLRRSGCGANISCLWLGTGDGGGIIADNDGVATPTLAPFTQIIRTPTPNVIDFNTATPRPTAAPADCETVVEEEGWLDIPFPYSGTQELFGGSDDQFRRISQRSRFGGRINSFFDHEYPVYPPAFRGWEPLSVALDLVIFDGSRVQDAFVQDNQDGDWYSGHAGIDFAPAQPLQFTTPILAAAAGRLVVVRVESDGNHAVWLQHDPDGDGVYQYATLYFHLNPDAYWDALLARYEAADEAGQRVEIAAGERLGTMGTTGRSTGIHLHFEVRQDIDGDGLYSRMEKVDPYGFFPSDEIPVDPWSQTVSWIDETGTERDHVGINSDYLWVHPLTSADNAADACVQDVRVEVDIYPILGYTVVDPGFTIVNRNPEGDVLREGPPTTRSMTILAEEIEGVDLSTISLDFFDPVLQRWVAVDGGQLVELANGNYRYTAQVTKTARYVLVGRQSTDQVPPVTVIQLDGIQVPGRLNQYQNEVTVTLSARDAGEPTPSGIRDIQFSLDCGETWLVYENPVRLTANMAGACGSGTSTSQNIELGPNDFLILAIATDLADNVEQPISQAFFTVIPPQ